MNTCYLPQIERVVISDYSLYKSSLDLVFSKKLNIVYGTNGTGKSTLLMIILFSIVGPYRGGIRTKVRQEQRRDNRPIYNESFFYDRTKNLLVEPVVKSFFTINEDHFEVSHSLKDGRLLSVAVNDKPLVGKIVSYRTYEEKFTKNRADEVSDDNLSDYLINKYHEELTKSSCLPGGVNTMISMLLDVMFFSEDRNLTFWSEGLQETIIGKYIVDSDFYEQYCAKKLDTKYLESLYKKKSETYNFMRKFFEQEKKKQKEQTKAKKDPFVELRELEKEVEKLTDRLKERQEAFIRQNKEVIALSNDEEKLNEKRRMLEDIWYKNLFPSNYQKFFDRYAGLMEEGICPACSNKHFFPMPMMRCIICGEKLEIRETSDLVKVDIERHDCNNEIKKIKQILKESSDTLLTLEKEIKNLKKAIDDDNVRINEIRLLTNPKDTSLTENDLKRLKVATEERVSALKDYNDSKKQEDEMKKTIENSLVENFGSFRKVFIKYASSFFGEGHKEDIILPFSDSKDELFSSTLIKFKLDGTIREEDYMLSESQRIFTDLAFRFSVLTTFHNKSFFICETPDSTLDMYHEEKAVNTFLEFINSGNTLFLSANARKGSLIHDLYCKFETDEVNVIDLTKLSNMSLTSDYSFERVNK